MQGLTLILDFDSTLVSVETLDLLCARLFDGHPEKESRLAEIRQITDLGMEGRISLHESLQRRLQCLRASRQEVQEIAQQLRQCLSPSMARNRAFFQQHADQIYIVSNGFTECILPVAQDLGIAPDHILANTLQWDAQDHICGVAEGPLTQNQGKAKAVAALSLQGQIVVVGDGITDLEIRQAGIAHAFYGFIENVRRESVILQADKVAPNFDEVLYDLNLKASLSYPKNRIRVLLLENVHPVAAQHFRTEGYHVETLDHALEEDELAEKIRDIHILGIRSKTRVTEKVLQQANRLLAIGTFCIGTNQIELPACTRRGIAVFNAPYSNTRSVVELALGEMILLLRGTLEKNRRMHAGTWDKKADHCVEVRGKVLGIVGYGNIGSQLSVLAEAIGMRVCFYDCIDKLALGNARKCQSLEALLQEADIVSLHVDGRAENTHLIDEKRLSQMKPGAVFLNLARGHLVDLLALEAALRSGHIRGAALDVFPEEPVSNQDPFTCNLQGLPNVCLTPHIGGSTEEAQENIGHFVPGKLLQYLNTGSTHGSVNLPEIQLPEIGNAHRIMHIHENVKGILADLNRVLADAGVNIAGQYLKTLDEIGYVITDIETDYPRELEKTLRHLPHTLRYRILY